MKHSFERFSLYLFKSALKTNKTLKLLLEAHFHVPLSLRKSLWVAEINLVENIMLAGALYDFLQQNYIHYRLEGYYTFSKLFKLPIKTKDFLFFSQMNAIVYVA